MKSLKVKDVMSPNPIMAKPEQTIRHAARIMQENGCGILPVGTPTKVLGMLTDRDIVVRVVAEGKSIMLTSVVQTMSKQVFLCEENDTLEKAAEQMRKHDVSRLIVTDGRVVTGIVTLADLLRNTGKRSASQQVMQELLYPVKKRRAGSAPKARKVSAK